MRRLIVVGALTLTACGSELPTRPPDPVYPPMVGGWGGSMVMTQQVNVTDNGRLLDPTTYNCAETWLINSQAVGAFSGTYQRTGTDCADTGTVQGTVSLGGNLTITQNSSARAGSCNLLPNNSTEFAGVVSAAGNITLQRDYWMSCPNPFPRNFLNVERVNYRQTWTATLSRR